MKKTFLILTLWLLANNVFAEYNGWYFTLEITTTNGDKITGYTYKATAYFDLDSLENSPYLIKRLNHLDRDLDQPVFTFFQHLLTYTYALPGDTSRFKAYTMLDTHSVPLAEVEHIAVVGMIDFWYLVNIDSPHKISDTLWMNQPPVETFIADGYMCSWDVFVHEKTMQTDRVLKELNAFNNKNAKQLAEWEKELEYAGSEYREEIKQKIEDLQESLDEKASKLLLKFDGEKVVIISFCSC